ncbi:MAG: hypothetical protein AB7T49_10375 [Oligoflexales bacterium]
MALKNLLALILAFATLGCKETFYYNSSDYKVDQTDRDVEFSEEEVQAIWAKLKARIESGENVDGTVRALIKIARSRLVEDNPLQSFKLDDSRRSQLKDKRDFYLAQTTAALNAYKFVDGCDGLLFTSLLRSSGYDVDLYQAQQKGVPGKWHRNATQDCLQTGQSESTISRDMLLGLVTAFLHTEDEQGIGDLIAYADENNDIMGDASSKEEQLSRTLVTPSLKGLFYEIQYRLTGIDNDLRGYIPDFDKDLTGFEAHLQGLRILLRGSLYEGLLDEDIEVLQTQLAKNPDNVVFMMTLRAFTTGDMNEAADLLLDPTLFPNDRLPSSSDRCEAYIWQRDQNSSDWQPCASEGKTHAGVDLLFAATYILGLF